MFDRYEAALKHSQEALHEEAMELHRATLAEDRLRATVRHRKRAARHAVASDLKVQMQEREKRNQRILLEQMVSHAHLVRITTASPGTKQRKLAASTSVPPTCAAFRTETPS